ncbi:hypothetical protein EV424DRAFT_1347690 [Suillus variegatus]|nr:hypothetical protein EV424DRAFT_1347690 [Suillus variegatus]
MRGCHRKNPHIPQVEAIPAASAPMPVAPAPAPVAPAPAPVAPAPAPVAPAPAPVAPAPAPVAPAPAPVAPAPPPVTLAPAHVTLAPVHVAPAPAPVPVAPALVAPAAAAAIATTLHRPRRQRQPPRRYRQDDAVTHPDNGEWIDINNVSGSEDDNDPPEIIANAHTHQSPLQTTTSTLPTNPFATKKEELRLLLTYCFSLGRTQTPVNAFVYRARDCLNEGWTFAQMQEQLKDPTCSIETLGPPPNPRGGGSLPGVGKSASLDRDLPDFSIEEMHRQIMKFIVADDQNFVSCSASCGKT